MIIKILNRGKGENGYILLDILIGLFVASIGFTAIFGAIKTSIDYTVKRENKLSESIILRNEKADEFEKVISY